MAATKSHWNQKVAKNRGPEWRKKLLLGRLDVQRNPTAVRLKRITKNMTQTEVAKVVGMSYTTYGAIESGRRPASEEVVQKICEVLELPISKKIFIVIKDTNKYLAVRD